LLLADGAARLDQTLQEIEGVLCVALNSLVQLGRVDVQLGSFGDERWQSMV